MLREGIQGVKKQGCTAGTQRKARWCRNGEENEVVQERRRIEKTRWCRNAGELRKQGGAGIQGGVMKT